MTDFTPIDCGDMSEIPPDLPAGKWIALCAVKKAKTQKEGFPMLVLEWHTESVADDSEENEQYVGARASDFVTFFPANHKASRMSRLRLKQMCDALKIDPPAVTRIQSWADLDGFVDSLEGLKAEIYTSVEVRKDTGAKVTKVTYTPPGRKLDLSAPPDDEAPKGKKGKR